MSEFRDLLERELDRLPARRVPFHQLDRRRHRKYRKQRVGAGVLAILVGIAAVGPIMYAFRGSSSRPASQGIDTHNVGRLRVQWSANVKGFPSPQIVDGVVYVVEGPFLAAFPEACGIGGATCEPSWRADVGHGLGAPFFADGLIYIARGHDVFGFDVARCAAAAGTCAPSWSGHVAGVLSGFMNVGGVDGGNVYTMTTGGQLFAFPATCDAGPCPSLWSISDIRDVAFGNGLVFATTLHGNELQVYRGDCPSGPPCSVLWSWTFKNSGSVFFPRLEGGLLYIEAALSQGRIFGFDPACLHACSPLWVADYPQDDVRILLDLLPQLFADPSSCGAKGTACPSISVNGWLTGGIRGVAAIGSAVFVSTDSGRLYGACAIDASPCDPHVTDTGIHDWVSVAATGDVVFAFSSYAGKVEAFSSHCLSTRDDCPQLWTFPTGDGSHYDVTIADGIVFITSIGKIYALTLPAPVKG